MRLANAVHHLHLQRDDGHGRPGLRQQLQRSVEQRVVEDGFVQLGIGRAGERGGGRGRCRGWCCSGGIGPSACHARRRPGRGRGGGLLHHIHQRIGIVLKRRRLLRTQLQRGLQRGQKLRLCRRLPPIHIAHAHGHLIGQLAVGRVAQRSGSGLHAGALEQHILVDARQVGHAAVARERLGDAADFLALGIVLGAVCKSGQQGNGEDGFLLFGVHAVRARRAVGRVGRSGSAGGATAVVCCGVDVPVRCSLGRRLSTPQRVGNCRNLVTRCIAPAPGAAADAGFSLRS